MGLFGIANIIRLMGTSQPTRHYGLSSIERWPTTRSGIWMDLAIKHKRMSTKIHRRDTTRPGLLRRS